MAASFYARLCQFGDWETDGGPLRPDVLARALVLYASGLVNAAYVKANCLDSGDNALTTAQANDVDTLLATMPGLVLNLVGAVDKALWASRVEFVLWAGLERKTGFTTEALVKTALGV